MLLESGDGDFASRGEDNSSLDALVVGTIKVVGASATTVATDSALLRVVVGLDVGIGIHKNLEEINFTTIRPARAGQFAVSTSQFSVLSGTGDIGIQGPDGGHVAVEVRTVLVLGHAELEEEDLLKATESIYSE